jgi:exonuclease SbcD
LRFGDLRAAYDLDAIAGEATVRGQFVRDVLDSQLEPSLRQRVLVTGLRALDGRDDLEVP